MLDSPWKASLRTPKSCLLPLSGFRGEELLRIARLLFSPADVGVVEAFVVSETVAAAGASSTTASSLLLFSVLLRLLGIDCWESFVPIELRLRGFDGSVCSSYA